MWCWHTTVTSSTFSGLRGFFKRLAWCLTFQGKLQPIKFSSKNIKIVAREKEFSGFHQLLFSNLLAFFNPLTTETLLASIAYRRTRCSPLSICGMSSNGAEILVSGFDFKFQFWTDTLVFISISSTEKTTTYDPRVDMIQNDDDPNCRDEFPNCNMVLKSKLCGYAYYNENCCMSCRMISNELF